MNGLVIFLTVMNVILFLGCCFSVYIMGKNAEKIEKNCQTVVDVWEKENGDL